MEKEVGNTSLSLSLPPPSLLRYVCLSFSSCTSFSLCLFLFLFDTRESVLVQFKIANLVLLLFLLFLF